MNDNINITGFVDGLPSSYDATYVIRTKKRCAISNKKIDERSINFENVVFIDGLGFCLKEELKNKAVEYKHLREDDKSSPAFILKKIVL